jgi:hypothetical protein
MGYISFRLAADEFEEAPSACHPWTRRKRNNWYSPSHTLTQQHLLEDADDGSQTCFLVVAVYLSQLELTSHAHYRFSVSYRNQSQSLYSNSAKVIVCKKLQR